MIDYSAILGGFVSSIFGSVNSTNIISAALVAAIIGIDLLFRWLRRVYEDYRADNDSSYGRY